MNLQVVAGVLFQSLTLASISRQPSGDNVCEHTKVLILGAGIAGIGAAQELSDHGIDDFVILEHNDYIGGRIINAPFGNGPDGTPYSVELGANWVHGRESEEDTNPVWTLVQKYNLTNTLSNTSKVATFDRDGPAEYLSELQDEFQHAQDQATNLAEFVEDHEMNDTSTRTGLQYGGWFPRSDGRKRAVEWWDFNYSNAMSPDETSLLDQFGDAGEVSDSEEFDSNNQFITDPRGYNTIVEGEASEFLGPNDSRLRLNTTVNNITYSNHGVEIHTTNGSCIKADYAICTFSIGVLQRRLSIFKPPLPETKRLAINAIQMGTYTKIFFQFNETFWGDEDQYFLYADETRDGYYPVWQSLSTPGFLLGSHIIFATVVGAEAERVERQTDEQTKKESLEVLRTMFLNETIPEPIAMMYPRWGQLPWAYGSYSSTPVGFDDGLRSALRENTGRVWFAGEALAKYQATTHGAWLNGHHVAAQVAKKLGEE